VSDREGSARAAALASRLREAGASLIAIVAQIEPARWSEVSAPGAWSVGKEAEHVAEGALYHQWIVRLTVGQTVQSRRPGIERTQLVTRRTPLEVAELLGRRTEEGASLVAVLTDAQLALPTRPPRARARDLADTIERVMIGHYHAHRDQIDSKLREPGDRAGRGEARGVE
jgi:hypothetical protein